MLENIEIAVVYDTTGSVAPCIGQVRKNVEEFFPALFKEIPNLKISIGAHGDYCDAGRSYVTKWLPLTNDMYALTQFVRNVGNTGGGDAPECYELVMHEAQKLNWSKDSRKILVMIGDDVAHESNYSLNKLRLDWRQEAVKLREMGVTIYAVQALARRHATSFWREIAQSTNGYHLGLGQFTDIIPLIMGMVHRQNGLESLNQYEEELVTSNRFNRSLDNSFGILKGEIDGYDPEYGSVYYEDRIYSSLIPRKPRKSRFAPIADGLTPVPDGRFQMLKVEHNMPIKEFVESNDIVFTIGRGFYELIKTELVQENKEIILRDKVTGDMFSGKQAREMIGLPFGTRGKVKAGVVTKYDVFCQSTSVNRKLIGGTRFLYEVASDR